MIYQQNVLHYSSYITHLIVLRYITVIQTIYQTALSIQKYISSTSTPPHAHPTLAHHPTSHTNQQGRSMQRSTPHLSKMHQITVHILQKE